MTNSRSRSKSKSSGSRVKNRCSVSPKRSNSRGSRRRNSSQRRPIVSHGRRDPDRIPKNAKLFITNIDSKYTFDEVKRDLEAEFSVFGKIKETTVKTKPGSSNSFVFVEFQNVADAARACEEMRSKMFKGKELKVEFGKGLKPMDQRSDRCYVCNKEGHFAKECRMSRYEEPRRQYGRRDYRSPSSSSSRSYRRHKHRQREDSREEHRHRDRRSRSCQRRSPYRRY